MKPGRVAAKTNHRGISAIPGRERWLVPAVEDRPDYAAAVEISIRRDPRVEEVHANPLTGRVLVVWYTGGPVLDVGGLLGVALQESPLTQAALLALNPDREHEGKARKLIGKLIIGGTKLVYDFREPPDLGRCRLSVSRFYWTAHGDGNRDYRIRLSSRVIPDINGNGPHHNRHAHRRRDTFKYCAAGEHDSTDRSMAVESRRIFRKPHIEADTARDSATVHDGR